MKKLCIVLILLLTSLPSFADNLLQQKAEKELNALYKNKFSEEQKLAIFNYMMINQDYLVYKYDNNSKTLYAELLKSEKESCNSNKEKDRTKCKYLKTVNQQIKLIGESSIYELNTIDNHKTIIIPDNEARILKGDDIILPIWMLNSTKNFPIDIYTQKSKNQL